MGFKVGRRFTLGLIAAAAFLVRLLHVFSFESIPTNDMAIFVEMATKRLTLATLFTREGFCYYTPGYALFLKPFYLFVSDPAIAERAVQVAQAALGAWTCVLLYHLARRLHSRRAGLVAAALTCFFPHFVFYTSNWMSENLFIPAYFGALLLLLRALQKPRPAAFLLAGLAVAAATLIRPAAMSLGPVALLVAWRAAPVWRGRARALILLAAGGAALMAPWGIRNQVAVGRFVLLTPYGGGNLAMGNNPEPDGISPRGYPPPPSGDIFEQSRYYRSQVLDFVTRDPFAALTLTLRRKWRGFWEFVVPWPLHSFNPMLLWGEHFFPFVSWRCVLMLGLAGVLPARRAPALWIVPLSLLGYVAFYMVFWGSSRYRMPAEGYFLAWSGITVVAAARLVPRLARAPAWGAALTVLLVAVFGQSALAAASARAALHRPDLLIATGDQFPVVTSESSISFFPDQPIPLDRARGRYLRLAFNAHRQGPFRKTPANGLVKITFFARSGRAVDWIDNPVYVLSALPAGHWVPVALKAHIPPAAVSCAVTLVPDKNSPDTLIIDQPALRYARGNDLAMEFLFPYLRFKE